MQLKLKETERATTVAKTYGGAERSSKLTWLKQKVATRVRTKEVTALAEVLITTMR